MLLLRLQWSIIILNTITLSIEEKKIRHIRTEGT